MSSFNRSQLAGQFSSLRRIRPTVPFWRLAAHRIPTLWQLYRGLLRSTSQHENIKWRLSTLFRANRHLTSPLKTKALLETAHKYLDNFRKAQERDDGYSRKLMDRYDRLIAVRTEKEDWRFIFRQEMEWSHKMNNRAILTGSIVRPTLFNKPFPRMRRQPVHVSRMIHKRRKARERRGVRQGLLLVYKDYIRHERIFESNLLLDVKARGLSFEPVFQLFYEWLQPLDVAINEIQKSYDLEESRSRSLCTPELLEQVKEARREKIRNKTREKQRERRGEVLNHTLERMRQGPPAHVLALMTPEQRRADRLVRSPSESGYTGMVKRQAGVKLKDDLTWRLEDGLPEMQEKLENLEKEYFVLQDEKRTRLGVDSDEEEKNL